MISVSTAVQEFVKYDPLTYMANVEPITIFHCNFEGDEGSNDFVDLTGRHTIIKKPDNISLTNYAHITTDTSNSGSSSLSAGLLNHGFINDYSNQSNSTGGGLIVDQSGHSDWNLGTGNYTIKVSVNFYNNNFNRNVVRLYGGTNPNTVWFSITQAYIPPAYTFREGYLQITGSVFNANDIQILRYTPSIWTTVLCKNINGIGLIYQDNIYQTSVDKSTTKPSISANKMLIGTNTISPNDTSAVDGYIDDIIVTKPVSVLDMTFTSVGNNGHIYTDGIGRHSFTEEGIVATSTGISYQGNGSLDARTGNIVSDNLSTDFFFTQDFFISMAIYHTEVQQDETFWTIYDSLDNEVLALKMTNTSLKVTGVSGVTLTEAAVPITQNTWNVVGVHRIGGRIRIQLNFGIGAEKSANEYIDIVSGKYIKIGCDGYGSNAFFDSIHIAKG